MSAWRPRKVAHLTTVDLSLRYLLWAQLVGARDAGAEVIGISAPGPDADWLSEHGIRHVALPGSTRSMDVRADLRAAIALWRILRRERPDVLHTHTPKPGVYGRILGRLAGVPVVVNTVHGLYATERDPVRKRAVVYALEAIASRFSDAELVQNAEDVELLGRLHIAAKDKTSLLGNGIDLERFHQPTPAERAAARAVFGAGDEVVIGYVGRLTTEKGLPELLEAHRRLGTGRLVLVGPASGERDGLDRAIVERATADGVMFLGMRHDVEQIYGGFDILCLPSHREGFPRAPMEAAACGVPSVATDVRGCRQAVADGDTGYLVPVADIDALTASLRALLDPDLRARMGAAARTLAESDFDERDVVERVATAYAIGRLRRAARVDRAKRVIDVVVSALGLVILSPVLAVAAATVRTRLGRPVLFTQVRPGRDGRPFTIFKLRTMRNATDAEGQPLPDEERLDRLGTFLRNASLDELPELWNVLRGDMSLVGPRPLLMEYLDRYSEEQARRHEAAPGLTGLAQVNGRNAQSWDERLAMDIDYVDRRSLALDARIVFRTMVQVVRRHGISEEGFATRSVFRGRDADPR